MLEQLEGAGQAMGTGPLKLKPMFDGMTNLILNRARTSVICVGGSAVGIRRGSKVLYSGMRLATRFQEHSSPTST